jgi:hypothetical protein
MKHHLETRKRIDGIGVKEAEKGEKSSPQRNEVAVRQMKDRQQSQITSMTRKYNRR